MVSSTQVRIRQLPDGHIRATDFVVDSAGLEAPGSGEVLIRNLWMSLDPYIRLVLTAQDGFVALLNPGDIPTGPAIGVVDSSFNDAFPVGTHVLSQFGWRSHLVTSPHEAALKLVDTDVPLEWHLGLLGLTGVTAWLGIEEVLQPARQETIFISGAAGAVGSIACQLAKRRGARVLGSAGSAAKAAWLKDELGVDAVLNYREQPIEQFLKDHAPHGVDCYFDNVGGAMLEAFLTLIRPGGRIGLCGAMSQYEQSDYRSGPRNFFTIVENDLCLQGFNAFRLSDDKWFGIVAKLKTLALNNEIMPCHCVVEGIAQVPDAFAQMFEGGQCGKLIVRI